MAVAAGSATGSFCLVKPQILPPSLNLPGFTSVKANPEIRVASNPMKVKARFGSTKTGGAGVLEKSPYDLSTSDPSTQVLEGGDIGRLSDKRGTGNGDSYRVLLIDDVRHTEKLVAKVLPQVVPLITSDGARRLFQESREKGVAVVIVTVKEHAEFYAQMMIRGGLRSTIEPDSSLL